MKTFVVRDTVNGVLVSLASVLAWLPELHAVYWSFKTVRFQYGRPFGLAVPEFERLSRDLAGGFIVSNEEFQAFLKDEFQLIDGVIEAHGSAGVILRIECEDASQWEINAEEPELGKTIEEHGMLKGAGG